MGGGGRARSAVLRELALSLQSHADAPHAGVAGRAVVDELHRMAALVVDQAVLAVEVAGAPLRQRAHDDAELAALVAQVVLGARRALGVEPPRRSARAPPSA